MGKFFKSIGDFFKRLFGSIVKEILANSTLAIAIVDEIEAVLNNPLAEFLISAIPGPAGDFIRKEEPKFQEILDEAVKLITGAQNCASQSTDKERLKCFIAYIATLPVLQQHAILLKLASIIENLLGGGQTEADSDTAVQMTYKQQQLDGVRPSSKILLSDKAKAALAKTKKK